MFPLMPNTGEIIWCLAEGLEFVGNMDVYRVIIIIGFMRSKFMMVKACRGEFPYTRSKRKKKERTSTRKFMLRSGC